MAIDYKDEWKKLYVKYGCCGVNIPHAAVSVTLRSIMENQIGNTIEEREKLMEEFVKSMFTTEIVEGMKDGYLVELRFKGGPMHGKMLITKKEFDTWLKRKEVK